MLEKMKTASAMTDDAVPLGAPSLTSADAAVGPSSPGELLAWAWVHLDGLAIFRWLVVACQAAGILMSWPLWQVHASPPMLPLLTLPALDLGVVLLLTLLLAGVRPLWGALAHTVVLGYAMLIDQTRIQPEFISLAFVLWGTAPSENARMMARFHLVSLWFFSGFNKLFSSGFMHGTAQWMLGAYGSGYPAWFRDNFGYAIVLAECGVAILALMPATRKLAAVLVFLLHANIFYVLSPWGRSWNEVVWPWNIALAFSGFALIAPWQGNPVASALRCHRAVCVAGLVIALAPIGFYFMLVDAYLAHNLYTSNTPREIVCDADNRCQSGIYTAATWSAFKVPIPPEHRVFESYFQQTCQPGERLIVEDLRWWAAWRGMRQRQVPCGG